MVEMGEAISKSASKISESRTNVRVVDTNGPTLVPKLFTTIFIFRLGHNQKVKIKKKISGVDQGEEGVHFYSKIPL